MKAIFTADGGYLASAAGVRVGREWFTYTSSSAAALPIPDDKAAALLARVRAHGGQCWLVDFETCDGHGKQPTPEQAKAYEWMAQKWLDIASNPYNIKGGVLTPEFQAAIKANLAWLFAQEFHGLSAVQLPTGKDASAGQIYAARIFTAFMRDRAQLFSRLAPAAKATAKAKAAAKQGAAV